MITADTLPTAPPNQRGQRALRVRRHGRYQASGNNPRPFCSSCRHECSGTPWPRLRHHHPSGRTRKCSYKQPLGTVRGMPLRLLCPLWALAGTAFWRAWLSPVAPSWSGWAGGERKGAGSLSSLVPCRWYEGVPGIWKLLFLLWAACDARPLQLRPYVCPSRFPLPGPPPFCYRPLVCGNLGRRPFPKDSHCAQGGLKRRVQPPGRLAGSAASHRGLDFSQVGRWIWFYH